uniref:Uncharacterized protein n=1 Tax=Arundo donax TaxID=35708 RepID=A0A0A9C0J7_ARUDO
MVLNRRDRDDLPSLTIEHALNLGWDFVLRESPVWLI